LGGPFVNGVLDMAVWLAGRQGSRHQQH
jgi:hypothetical protein